MVVGILCAVIAVGFLMFGAYQRGRTVESKERLQELQDVRSVFGTLIDLRDKEIAQLSERLRLAHLPPKAKAPTVKKVKGKKIAS